MVKVYTRFHSDKQETCVEFPTAVDFVAHQDGYLHLSNEKIPSKGDFNPDITFSMSSGWVRVEKENK